MGLLSRFYDRLVRLIDHPFTISFALAIITLPAAYYVLTPIILLLGLQDFDQDIILESIQWFGVLYGVLIPLTLVHVQTQFGTTQQMFDREAGFVLEIYNTFLLLHDRHTEKTHLKNAVIGYIQHVTRAYSLEYYKAHTRLLGDGYINKIRVIIKRLVINGENETIISELLHLTNELLSVRRERVSIIKQTTTDVLFYLSTLASIFLLIPLFALNFESILIRFIYLGGLTFFVALIIQVIYDLWEPIGGVWKIKLDAWTELENIFEDDPF